MNVIYDLQKSDTEPPEIASIRLKLNELTNKTLSKSDINGLSNSLKILVPGFISIEGEKIGINSQPEIIIEAINKITSSVPPDFQKLYINALCIKE